MQDAGKLSARAWWVLLGGWLIALVSSLGSLVFSETLNFEPCVLCWHQRIAMFPLVVILAQGLYTQDRQCVKYALPLAFAGGLLALYHCLLYGGFIPKGMQPCGKGVSCADQKLELAGFITIPLLSLVAFTLIILILLAIKKDLTK